MCGKYCSIEHEDMSPTQPITVICLYQNQMVYQKKIWGYTVSIHSSRIINARCETLFSKKIFQEDIQQRRCVIPAQGFYQKDSTNHSVQFVDQQDQVLFMAGIYHDNEVTIITTKANEVMKPIHDRMPLFIPKHYILQWLQDTDFAKEILKKDLSDLKIVSGHIQQSLF